MKSSILYRIFPLVLAAIAALPVSGQNLDPTVEVSRAYEGKLMEVHKPQLKMAVPDSVLRFDLEFDYSVSESPYKGAYEFSPYTLDMKPSPTIRDINSFYLKAGAGYQLHPVFDMVWSPVFKSPFRMNVYASHRSFVGKYHTISSPSLADAEAVLGKMEKADGSSRSWPGYDLRTKAGVEGRYDWRNAFFGFDAAYEGMHQQERKLHVSDRGYNSAVVNLVAASKNHPDVPFQYKADVSYRFAEDNFNDTAFPETSLMENDFAVEVDLAYAFRSGDRLALDLDYDMAMVDGNLFAAGGDFDVVSHYVMDRNRWHLDVGVRISSAFRTDGISDMYGYEDQTVYPDIRVEYKAIKDAMKVYLDLGGDSRVNSYADLLAYNPRAHMHYGRGLWNILDIEDEKFAIAAGLEGRIGTRFSYDLSGGYASYGNALLDGAVMQDATAAILPEWMPALGYASYDKAFASLEWLLALEHFRFDGTVNYAYYASRSDETDKGLLFPAALTGDVAFAYDWKERVYVGLDCSFSSARKGTAYYSLNQFMKKPVDACVPGYADLGLEFEYVVNRKLSAWVRGGNLLGMTIQRSLLYAEKGPYFTLGICLNL